MDPAYAHLSDEQLEEELRKMQLKGQELEKRKRAIDTELAMVKDEIVEVDADLEAIRKEKEEADAEYEQLCVETSDIMKDIEITEELIKETKNYSIRQREAFMEELKQLTEESLAFDHALEMVPKDAESFLQFELEAKQLDEKEESLVRELADLDGNITKAEEEAETWASMNRALQEALVAVVAEEKSDLAEPSLE